MYSMFALCALWLVLILPEIVSSELEFTNTWVVEIIGGPEVAAAVAGQHGYEIFRQVGQTPDLHYLSYSYMAKHQNCRRYPII